MDNKIINNETELIEKMNNPGKEIEIENDINKANDINTTKEEDSIYIIDEIISYCSSPTSGIVSVNKTKKNNNTFINIGPEISNITNTITLKISMIKKEINNIDFNHLERSNTEKKKVIPNKDQKEGGNNNIGFINSKACSNKDNHQNDKDKRERDKIKSFFKKKTKKLKDNKVNTKLSNEEINLKKKGSKGKKKKTRKSQDKFDFKNFENLKSSSNIEKDKNIKKNRKKTQKLKEHEYQKMFRKKNSPEPEKEKDQTEIDEGKSPKIIIMDFSTSGNNDENEYDSEKNLIINKSREEEKNENYNNKHSVNLSSNNSFAKIPENEFFSKKHKTKNDIDEKRRNSKYLKKEFEEKKIIVPRSKNSCLISKSYKINNQAKFENNLNNRKLSANCGFDVNNSSIIRRKSKEKIDEIQKFHRKNKKRNSTEDFYMICASKNFCHNDDSNKHKIVNTTAIKENIRKSTKIKMKSKLNIDKKGEPPDKKDSNKSCHNAPNKKFRHIISHNYDKKFNHNIEKKLNINMSINSKNIESNNFNYTPKNNSPKKNIYQSNRNLTNIKISSQAVQNKDIHLEMNGKQETIINYTNQEMVDDENEYMVECFKVLLKLDLSKQPRCKSKVNFNFENSSTEKNKKIALFDLDETLVHCTKDKKGLNGDSVNIKLPTNKVVNVGLNIRPHWKEALDLIKNHYHIVVYTASHQSYADAVLDYLDKENKYFQYRLYRNHCVQCDVDGIKFYVKDLDTLNEKYNLKDVVLIDNSVLSFAYHLNNGIPIVPYIEQKEDSQLLMLAYYLVSIANFEDLTEENKKHINIEHFIQEVKNLENEEEEEEEDEGEENNNNAEEKNKEKNNDNNDNIIKENKNEDNNSNDNKEKIEEKGIDENTKKELKKQSSFDSKKFMKKLSCRKSEKALKIANDMKRTMVDVYNKNYN